MSCSTVPAGGVRGTRSSIDDKILGAVLILRPLVFGLEASPMSRAGFEAATNSEFRSAYSWLELNAVHFLVNMLAFAMVAPLSRNFG